MYKVKHLPGITVLCYFPPFTKMERYSIWIDALQSGPLSSEGSLASHAFCDKGWHIFQSGHLHVQEPKTSTVTARYNDFGLSRSGFKHPTFRMRYECTNAKARSQGCTCTPKFKMKRFSKISELQLVTFQILYSNNPCFQGGFASPLCSLSLWPPTTCTRVRPGHTGGHNLFQFPRPFLWPRPPPPGNSWLQSCTL